MKRWLTSLFFLIVLVGSVPAGTPFADSGAKKNICPMKCCKKMRHTADSKTAAAKFICRTLVCSQNSPTNTTGSAQMNFAPMLMVSEKATLFEILFSTRPKEDGANNFSPNNVSLKTSQPIYIRYKSLLI